MKEEMDKKLLEQRAVFIEKAKNINIEAVADERPRKSGSKVSCHPTNALVFCTDRLLLSGNDRLYFSL